LSNNSLTVGRENNRRFPPPWPVKEQVALTGAPNIQPEFIFERRKFSQ